MKNLVLRAMLCLIFVPVASWYTVAQSVQPTTQDPDFILKECIKNHGGEEKFSKIQDVYAKMDARTITDKGDIESVFYEYYRKPDKLRIEIHPLVDPPTKIGWDGQNAWQMSKDKLEQSQDQKLVDRLQESLKFVRLMMLTSLLEKGSALAYENYIPKSTSGIHVISQTAVHNEKIKLFIRDKDFVLLGAEFYWDSATTLLRLTFAQHRWYDGLYLPLVTKVYKENQLVMEVKLKTAQVNAIKNGNSFFKELTEKAQIK